MKKKVYEGFSSDEVTDEMLEEASKLFSEKYGVWSEHAAQLMRKFAKVVTFGLAKKGFETNTTLAASPHMLESPSTVILLVTLSLAVGLLMTGLFAGSPS